MRDLKRLSLVTALALAAVACTAASASADIANSQGTYQGPISASGWAEFGNGAVTVRCENATFEGEIDGDSDETGPATGVLDFHFAQCTASGTTCNVDSVLGLEVVLPEANAPDWTITNTENFGTLIQCSGGVFSCTVSSNASTSPVTADVDSDTQVTTIDDTVDVSGIGCPTSGQWRAEYLITEPEDLFATGSQ